MNPYYLLVVGVAFLNTLANLLLKTGAGKIGTIPHDLSGILSFSLKLVSNWFLIGGLFFFGLGFLVWVLILNKVPLGSAAPLMSLGYVFILVLSYFLFKEPITATKIVGVLVILLGVIIITR